MQKDPLSVRQIRAGLAGIHGLIDGLADLRRTMGIEYGCGAPDNF
jgi:hypothetical protein